jgi:hypothetical protein
MSDPKLPGMPRRRYVDKGDRHTPYDREALRRKILDALQHGPMEKWKLRGRPPGRPRRPTTCTGRGARPRIVACGDRPRAAAG